MGKRKIWLIAIAAVLVLGLSYLAYSFFFHDAGSLTVGELKAQAGSLYGQRVKVEGRIAPGSIEWDEKSGIISFVLITGKDTLKVVYEGIAPDSFKPGANLIVVGEYNQGDVLVAHSLGGERSLCNVCH